MRVGHGEGKLRPFFTMRGREANPAHYHENPIGYYKDKIPNFPPQGQSMGFIIPKNMGGRWVGGWHWCPLDSPAITP